MPRGGRDRNKAGDDGAGWGHREEVQVEGHSGGQGTGCRPYRFGTGKTREGQRWSAALVMGTWEKEEV